MRTVHKPNQAINNIRGTPPSYDTSTSFEDGAYQTYVTARCIECAQDTRVHWNTGGADPSFVERKFRGLGWRFDAWKPRQCVCPQCLRRRGGRTTEKTVNDHLATLSEEPDDMAKSTNSYTPPATDTAVLRAAQTNMEADDAVGRTLTAHEKAKVRRLLDIHFDDGLGRYIDNYDDQRVGKETDVPWALVTELREFAYGPLKADPVVEAVKAEALALRQEFVQLSNALESVRQRVASIEGRLTNVEAKAKKL